MKRNIYKYLFIIMAFNLNFMLIITPALAYIETKSIIAVEDAKIDANNPNTNYGGDNELEIGYQIESFVKFDLSNAPVNFSRVVLKIEIISVDIATRLRICKATNEWDEYNITVNNKPSKGLSLSMMNITKKAKYVFDVTYGFDLTKTHEFKTRYWSICLTSYGLTKDNTNRIKIASTQCLNRYSPPKLIFYYGTSILPVFLGSSLLVLVVFALIVGLSWNAMKVKTQKKVGSPLKPQIKIEPSEPLTIEEEVKYCVKCGNPNKKNATFCEECGAKLPF